jgi:hypothetical protein
MIPQHLEQRTLRLHFVEKWALGLIAREPCVHHSTVKRVLHNEGIAAKPSTRPSMVDPFVPFIYDTFAQYQTLPANRLHPMLVERGYPGSESHFRRVVSTRRPRKSAEAFQRLTTLPGEEGQMDLAAHYRYEPRPAHLVHTRANVDGHQ